MQITLRSEHVGTRRPRHARRQKRRLFLEHLESRQLLASDFGDAPDSFAGAANYPTRLESDGARHTIVAGGPFLGRTAPDAEPDAEQGEIEIEIMNAGFDVVTASSADATPIVLNPRHFTSSVGTADISDGDATVGTAFVPGWTAISGLVFSRGVINGVDLFNPPLEDGDHTLYAQSYGGQNGVVEQVLGATVEPDTIYTLTVEIGDQVELPLPSSHLVAVFADGAELSDGITDFSPPLDGQFSTLTRSYVTGPDANGTLAIRLGELSTSFAGQVNYNNVRLTARSALADQDDVTGVSDEDGLLVFRSPSGAASTLVLDDSFTAVVEVSGAGRLNAFADWNRDGDWDDDGERIASDVTFDAGAGATTVELSGNIPATAVSGPSFLRLRVDTLGGLGPRGEAADGEVEDYAFQLIACPLTVTHTGDSGVGSLRAAIDCANDLAGHQAIAFNIAPDDPNHFYYRDDGVDGAVSASRIAVTEQADDADITDRDPDWPHSWYSIVPQSGLPEITDPVLIDGYTQAGASENSKPVGSGLDSILRVEINGSEAGALNCCGGGMLVVTGGDSTIRGLAINRTQRAKIKLEGAGNTRIEGNVLGPDVSGTLSFEAPASGTELHGVTARLSEGNVIGGLDAPSRNLISGNPEDGIHFGSLSLGNLVQGNLIGTTRSGTEPLGNGFAGVVSNRDIIGGADPAAQNVISGNVVGVFAPRGEIWGNLIGTDVSGNLDVGNTAVGVLIGLNGSGVQTVENTIAFNGAAPPSGGIAGTTSAAGIRVVGSRVSDLGGGNLISRNSIHSNHGVGIDLLAQFQVGIGVTPNDGPPDVSPPDQDSGANGLQNFPSLIAVTEIAGGTRIQGTLHSTPDSPFRIEFFASDARDDSNHGEGRTFLQSIEVRSDVNGLAEFTTDVPTLPADQPFVTATATDVAPVGGAPRNNTSEFSFVEPLGGCRFTVTNTGDTGLGTLREAMTCANLTTAAQTIDFAIPADDPRHFYYRDDGVAGQVSPDNVTATSATDDAQLADIDPDWPHSWFSILPESVLPRITDTVTIDGYTQDGSERNTLAFPEGLDTLLKIELEGSRVLGDGLTVAVNGEETQIEGIAVNSFGGNGIVLGSLDGSTVAGSFVGTDVSGTLDRGNGGNGVFLNDEPNAVIGGVDAADRNLFSGNDSFGIQSHLGAGASFEGNIIGGNRDASQPIRNSLGGFSSRATAGGTAAKTADAQRISANLKCNQPLFLGSQVFMTWTIWTEAFEGCSLNWLGNAVKGGAASDLQGRTTAFDLGDDGITPNDIGDLDEGPNGLQNFPVLTSAGTIDGVTTVTGTLNSLANTSFRIEIYSSSYDTRQFRGGERPLGSFDVTTDGDGNAAFTFVSPESVPLGDNVISLATRLADLDGNPLTEPVPFETSEFSAGLEVTGPLVISSFVPGTTGFRAEFSTGLNSSLLNLYDTQNGGHGPADVVVEGATQGRIAGSLAIDANANAVTFIKTGGPLPPDTYTVTVRSAADGFRATGGLLLDGDGDGMAGGDFVSSFVVGAEPSRVTLSVPDFIRGPGQPVNLPADSQRGVPFFLSDGAGVRSVEVRIDYDSSLLEISGATVAPQMPSGATVTVDPQSDGAVVITFASPDDLPPGNNVLAYLQADVPSEDANAIYGRQQVLTLSEIAVRDANALTIPAIADDGFHLVSYFGDPTGNGRINAGDASHVARFAAQLDRGFSGALMVDPILVGDISGNGRVNAADASRVARFAALLPVPEIPPLSGGIRIAGILDRVDGVFPQAWTTPADLTIQRVPLTTRGVVPWHASSQAGVSVDVSLSAIDSVMSRWSNDPFDDDEGEKLFLEYAAFEMLLRG